MKLLKVAALAAAAALTACGGGGGDSAPANQSAEGIWNAADSSLLIEADGTAWGIDSDLVVLKGKVSVSDTKLTGSGTVYDGYATASATLNGTVTAKKTLGVTLSTSAGSATRTMTYSTNYDQAATVASVAGSYRGTAGDVLTVSSGGAISGSSSNGCTYTGTLIETGKGYYVLSVSFGPSPCSLPLQTVSGVTAKTGTAGQLVYGIANSSVGTADILTKQ